MANTIRVKRGTTAQIDAAAAANGLQQGELYLDTDRGRLVIGLGTNGYTSLLKGSDLESFGSDANGAWVRYQSGYQVCWHRVSVEALAISTAYFGGFRTGGQTWTFPAPFIAVPSLQLTADVNTAFGMAGTPTMTNASYAWTAVTTTAAATRAGNLKAEGFWK